MKDIENSLMRFSRRGESLVGQEMFKILDLAKDIEAAGSKIIHLELGDPFLYPPGRIVNETIASLLNSDLGYTSSSGLLELRQSIVGYLNEGSAFKYELDNVVISVANMLVTQLLDLICDPGDRVGLFIPAFPTYLASSSYIGLRVESVRLNANDGFQVTKDAVDKLMAASPKVVFINSGNNPTGAVYSKSVLDYLVARAADQGVWIVSDETYGMLSFEKIYSGLSCCDYNKVITISSFSKVFNLPGYRVGYAVANPLVSEKISLSSSTLFSCLPIFTQKGISKGLSVLREFSAEKKFHYKEVLEKCVDYINASNNIRCVMPDSGFYLFIDISRLEINDREFSVRLLNECGVAVTPGSSFNFDGFIRISVSGESVDVLEGVKKIVYFVDNMGNIG